MRFLDPLRRTLAGLALVASTCAFAQQAFKPAPGFDGSTISVGYIGPLTGPVAVLGQPVLAGLQTWFDGVNARGGIAGKYKVRLVTEDHQNMEPLAVQKYGRIKEQVVALSMFGTHTTKAILPELRRDRLVASPVGFEGFMIRDPNLLPIGSTYELMAINAGDYVLNKGGRSSGTYCALVRDDPYGQAGLKGWRYAMEQSGRKVVQVAYLAMTDRDFTGQVNQLKSAGCDTVLVTTVPGQLVNIASSAARANYAPLWVGQWPSWHGTLLGTPVADYLEKNLIVAGEGVEWASPNVPGMAAFLADLNRYRADQKPDMWAIVGYNQGRAMTALLEKAVAGGNLSREAVTKALSSLGTVDNQGLGGNYKYGAIASRAPAMAGSVFKINRNKPFGLEALEVNYTSPMTRSFGFEETAAAAK